MAEVTSVWLSPDRSYLVVQTDGEDGPLLGIDLSRTHPDGITPECHDQDAVDASFDELYPTPDYGHHGTCIPLEQA